MIENKTGADIFRQYQEDGDKILDRIGYIKDCLKQPMSFSDRETLRKRLRILEEQYETICYAIKMMRSDKL